MEQDDETDRLTSRRIRYCERKSFSTVSSSALALDEFEATLFGVLSGDGGTGGDPGITRRRFDASDVGVPPWPKLDDTVGEGRSRIIKAFEHAPMVPRSAARRREPSICRAIGVNSGYPVPGRRAWRNAVASSLSRRTRISVAASSGVVAEGD